MNHWIIDSLDSFKRLIHSETKQVTVFMNESLNHWLTWLIQTVDSFRNKAGDCLYEWVTESLTHLISFKQLIHSETKQVTVFMNESLNHWLTWLIQTVDSFRNKAGDCLYECHWIIDSLDSFKRLIHSETKQVTVFMNESLNHWLTWFIQTTDSFRNKVGDCLYEWITESLTHLIHSNGWFIQKQSRWLSLWMNHWIIDSLDSFKRLIHSETKQVTVFMKITESLTHLIHSNGWFIQKQSRWLSLWMNHWIIDSLDSFKRLIHSETKQVTVFMNESLNHNSLDSFKRLIHSETKQVTVFMNESLTHSIHSKPWIKSVMNHCCVFLGDAQQFCCGNIFICKHNIESKTQY